jgi:ACS family tartrate transporter-like MFS transporter
MLVNPVLALVALAAAWAGVKALHGPFWALPPSFLTGSGAAAGIAFINSVGNLGGLAGPWLAGALKKGTNSFSTGLLVSGLLLLGAGLASLALPKRSCAAQETSH